MKISINFIDYKKYLNCDNWWKNYDDIFDFIDLFYIILNSNLIISHYDLFDIY